MITEPTAFDVELFEDADASNESRVGSNSEFHGDDLVVCNSELTFTADGVLTAFPPTHKPFETEECCCSYKSDCDFDDDGSKSESN